MNAVSYYMKGQPKQTKRFETAKEAQAFFAHLGVRPMKIRLQTLYAAWLRRQLADCNEDAAFHMGRFQKASKDAARISARLESLYPAIHPKGGHKLLSLSMIRMLQSV